MAPSIYSASVTERLTNWGNFLPWFKVTTIQTSTTGVTTTVTVSVEITATGEREVRSIINPGPGQTVYRQTYNSVIDATNGAIAVINARINYGAQVASVIALDSARTDAINAAIAAEEPPQAAPPPPTAPTAPTVSTTPPTTPPVIPPVVITYNPPPTPPPVKPIVVSTGPGVLPGVTPPTPDPDPVPPIFDPILQECGPMDSCAVGPLLRPTDPETDPEPEKVEEDAGLWAFWPIGIGILALIGAAILVA
jgi:hypothetical protein